MSDSFRAVVLLMALGLSPLFCGAQAAEVRPDVAEQLLAQANQARAAAGVGPLQWDEALAQAALAHTRRMARETELSHQYTGESALEDRAGLAGAHFSLIEENIGLATNSAQLHPGWMNSPGHRRNLLNPAVDHVGIAVIHTRGAYYATQDFARAVEALAPVEVESRIAALLRAQGVAVGADARDARVACGMDRGLPASLANDQPEFVMRWQDANLARLPAALTDHIRARQFRRALVGSCPARGGADSFTVYRVAVLLYAAAPQP